MLLSVINIHLNIFCFWSFIVLSSVLSRQSVIHFILPEMPHLSPFPFSFFTSPLPPLLTTIYLPETFPCHPPSSITAVTFNQKYLQILISFFCILGFAFLVNTNRPRVEVWCCTPYFFINFSTVLFWMIGFGSFLPRLATFSACSRLEEP